MQTDIPCGICELSEAAHPVYAAGIGEHDYVQGEPLPFAFPVSDTERLANERVAAGLDQNGQRPCRCATSDSPAQHHCGESPSDRLPAYQTGRVPTQTEPSLPEHMQGREVVVSADVHRSIDFTTERPSIFRRILNATRRNT